MSETFEDVFRVAEIYDDRQSDDFVPKAQSSRFARRVVGIHVTVAEFRDQNKGNCKAALHLCLLNREGVAVVSQDLFGFPRKKDCSNPEKGNRFEVQFGSDAAIVQKTEPGYRYDLRYTVGGGGLHKIDVKDFVCAITMKTASEVFCVSEIVTNKTSAGFRSAGKSNALTGQVLGISIAVAECRDQGWGDSRTALHLCLLNKEGVAVHSEDLFGILRSPTERGRVSGTGQKRAEWTNRGKYAIIKPSDKVPNRFRAQFGADAELVQKARPGYRYDLRYIVDGGNHEILVNAFECVIRMSDDDTSVLVREHDKFGMTIEHLRNEISVMRKANDELTQAIVGSARTESEEPM